MNVKRKLEHCCCRKNELTVSNLRRISLKRYITSEIFFAKCQDLTVFLEHL